MKNFGTFGIYTILLSSVFLGGLYKQIDDEQQYRQSTTELDSLRALYESAKEQQLMGNWLQETAEMRRVYVFSDDHQGMIYEGKGCDAELIHFDYRVIRGAQHTRLELKFIDTGKRYRLDYEIAGGVFVLKQDPRMDSSVQRYQRDL